MKSLSAEVKERIVLFYQNHNAEETARVFGVKKQSVFRYNRLYDGTIESLMDGRKNRSRKDAFTEEEEARLRASLIVYNQSNCKRYIIAPSFTEVYRKDPKYRWRRTYQAVVKKAREILSRFVALISHKKSKQGECGNRAERRKYHPAKKPGTLQIDMMCVPKACYWEAMSSPENLAKVRELQIREARRATAAEIKAYQREAKNNPHVIKLLLTMCKEAKENLQKICDDIMGCTAEQLVSRWFYQYTAVDECTGWAYRKIYTTHSEASAMLFLAEVINHAPFKIEKVHTDNGTEFTSKGLNNHGPSYETSFEECLLALGIKYYRIQPGKPWQNGRVECQHRLDRERFYNRVKFSSLEEAQMLLAKYSEESNNYYRPSRGGKSAMEMLAEFQKGDAE